MTLPDDFTGFPRSLAEIRSDKSGNCEEWTPRDALISLLRDIDEGRENVTDLIIAFRVKKDDGDLSTGFRNACPDIVVAQGLMARVSWRLNDPEG